MVPPNKPDAETLRRAVAAFVELAFSFEEHTDRWYHGADDLSSRTYVGKVLNTLCKTILDQHEKRRNGMAAYLWVTLRDWLAAQLPQLNEEHLWTEDLKRKIANGLCARFEEQAGYAADRDNVLRVLLETPWSSIHDSRNKQGQGCKPAALAVVQRIAGSKGTTGSTAQKRLRTLKTDRSPLTTPVVRRSAFRALGRRDYLAAVPLGPGHKRQLLVEYLAGLLAVGPVRFVEDEEPPKVARMRRPRRKAKSSKRS